MKIVMVAQFIDFIYGHGDAYRSFHVLQDYIVVVYIPAFEVRV